MALLSAAAFYMRLSQGPVSLDFMTDTVQSRINANLSGMAIEIGGVVIERPPGDEFPRLRLRDLVLRDSGGNVIARAPRAAIGIDGDRLWALSVVPRTLELIGPRIFVKRNLKGGIELGFGRDEQATPGAAQGKTVHLGGEDEVAKSDRPATEDLVPDVAGGSLIDVLAGSDESAGSTIGSVEDIRVSNAELTLYDVPNNAVWNSPHAQLAFRRMPYGFIVVTTASIANGAQAGTWNMEMSASYRRESKSFAVSARIYDLVPAYISEKVFALAQLARVKTPLSGHAEFEVTQNGELTKASAEFSAEAGEVGFPDYLAEPVKIDEGSLHADYDPASGGVIIRDSTLLLGTSRAELTGSFVPVRNEQGLLTALRMSLRALNAPVDAGAKSEPDMVDKIEFDGVAGIETAKLDIGDLVVLSGQSGLRLRGTITGGGKTPGLLLSGRVRDVSATLLRKLWPPIVAPKTRNWVYQNVRDGRIPDGSFQINLPVDGMARAQLARHLPPGAIRLQFNMENVTSSYFKDLPQIEHAAGEAQLLDNNFTLKMRDARIALPSGSLMQLDLGSMDAVDILSLETMATFNFDARAKAQPLLEYLGLPALNLIASSGVDTAKLDGDARLNVTLRMPLVKNLPRERVMVEGKARLENTSIKGALDKIDITGGAFDLTLAHGVLDAAGDAKLNGIDGKITWHRDAGKGARQAARIETTLDDEDRKKIGIDLGDFIAGPVPVTIAIDDLGNERGEMGISADLSKVAMRIDTISWSRPPTPKTSATLKYLSKGDQGRRVENLAITGPGLSIRGAIALKPTGGMKEADLDEVVLGDENSFVMKVKPTASGSQISISGGRFDARPLIKSMFASSSKTGGGHDQSDQTIQISANVDRVYANRGEEITGVSASIATVGGRVKSADVAGSFLSGQPIVLRIVPGEQGRQLSITGRDAGAALRAANLYSKIAGGQINFTALLANDAKSSVRNGRLVIRDFDVRNEAALAELDQKGKPKKSGPRRDGISFRSLGLPFTADDKFMRIGNSLIKGPDMGAAFSGIIRKADGAIDITGTIIPAYALNAALGEIPLFGDILTGGRGQGVIGITFALGGSVDRPNFQVNPVSAIAPGFLRKLFEFQGTGRRPAPAAGQPSRSQ